MIINVIGDEIHADGYLVALLVSSGAPATVLGQFRDEMDAETLFEPEGPVCEHCDAETVTVHETDCKYYDGPAPVEGENPYGSALDDVVEQVRSLTRGGWVRTETLLLRITQLRDPE